MASGSLCPNRIHLAFAFQLSPTSPAFREDESGWHDPVWFVLLGLGQLFLTKDILNGIGIDQVVDLQQLGFLKKLQLCFNQFLLIQLLATLLGQIGCDIILQLFVHLVVEVALVEFLEVLQVMLICNHPTLSNRQLATCQRSWTCW